MYRSSFCYNIAGDELIYACDNCHFLFSRTTEPEQYPDCGKYAVRKATEAERQKYEERLKEPREI